MEALECLKALIRQEPEAAMKAQANQSPERLLALLES